MSLTQINTIFTDFLIKVAKKHNLNENDLIDMWNGNPTQNIVTSIAVRQTPAQSTTTVSTPPVIINNELKDMNKTELVELCRIKKLPVSGTKAQIIERICKADNNGTINFSREESASPVTVTTPVVVKSPVIVPITKKLVEKIPKIEVSRNKFGNFEHFESSFVFDQKTQKVYGKQKPDGSIDELTEEDIDLCNKYKFTYNLPKNLDRKSNLLDVKVDELEDDEDEIELEVEEEFDLEDEDEEDYDDEDLEIDEDYD
jgi:hypothetical protein